jgi:F-type H+-transporting ATPase subunit delta
MPNPRLAARYAKSLLDLANEQQQLETVYQDMQYMRSLCEGSQQFVSILRSPVIRSDKKLSILKALTDGRISVMTATFNQLMVSKTREEFLPEVITAFIGQYDEMKGIEHVTLTTATPISDAVRNAIINKLKQETSMKQITLKTAVKEELIGGFVLEFNNNLVDASIAKELRDIRKQFRDNIYVQQLR